MAVLNHQVLIILIIYTYICNKCCANYVNCSLYLTGAECLADYGCLWDAHICSPIDESCGVMKQGACILYEQFTNGCFWHTEKRQCLPIHIDCSKNEASSCLRAKKCMWNGRYCDLVYDYHKECSTSITDDQYSGTHNVTCEGVPCLNWEFAFRNLKVLREHEYGFHHDSYKSANNFCRRTTLDHGKHIGFMGSSCLVNISINNEFVIKEKACCVQLCDDSHVARSKCTFSERGRYEYIGNHNVSCQGNNCLMFPHFLLNKETGQGERLISSDFPVDKPNINLRACNHDLFMMVYVSQLCFDLQKCRNPSLDNEGDFCIAPYKMTGSDIEMISKQKCCIAKCEDGDQVPCTWSKTGREYSGRIDMTLSGNKCVNWSRSLHKSDHFAKINTQDSRTIVEYKQNILSMFPDHSLDEAANYCRNPTQDPCGPWCYTSYADNSREYCNVPECEAANKGGKSVGAADCINQNIKNGLIFMKNIFQSTIFMIGIPLNIFSFIVFHQNCLRDSTTSYLFRVLALFDSFALIMGPGVDFFTKISGLEPIENIHNIVCKMYWPVRYYIWCYPGWIIVSLTFERCICICRPFDATLIFSRTRAQVYLLITGVFVMLVFSPNMMYKTKWVSAERAQGYHGPNQEDRNKYFKTEGECVSLPTDQWTNNLMTFMVYVDFVFSALLPFTIMCICNTIIVIKLFQKQKIQKQISPNAASGLNLANLTTTLLVVSFTYMLLTAPSTILVIGWNYFGITSGHSSDTIKLCRSLAKILLNINNSLNYIQYACTGNKFRSASKDVLNHVLRLIQCK